MAEISTEARNKLDSLAAEMQTLAFAEKVWSRLLTPEERELLGGNLEAAWKEKGLTLGMVSYVWQCSAAKALLRVCKEFAVLPPADFRWLCKELEISDLTAADSEANLRPVWMKSLGELRFQDEIVRKFRSITLAKNSVGILDAFHEVDWCRRIDNPLGCDSQGLREAVRWLNAGLKRLRFEMDGTGAGVRWKIL